MAVRVGGRLELIGASLLGIGLMGCGEARAGAPLLLHAASLAEAEDLVEAGHMAVSLAYFYIVDDQPERGRELIKRLVARARREGALTVLPFALASLAEAEFRAGDWTTAYAAATESVALADEVQYVSEL